MDSEESMKRKSTYNYIKNNKRYKMTKIRKVFYIITLIVGIILSIGSIHLEEYKYSNSPRVDYFIGISASLIITVLFAFIIEWIAIDEQNNIILKKRKFYILPMKNYISDLFIYSILFVERENHEKKYVFDDFSRILKQAFELYFSSKNQLSKNTIRYSALINKEYFEFLITQLTITPLIKLIYGILNNQYLLIIDNVFEEDEIRTFKELIKTLQALVHLCSSDLNSKSEVTDIPKELSDYFFKEMCEEKVNEFVGNLKKAINKIEELKVLEKIAF